MKKRHWFILSLIVLLLLILALLFILLFACQPKEEKETEVPSQSTNIPTESQSQKVEKTEVLSSAIESSPTEECETETETETSFESESALVNDAKITYTITLSDHTGILIDQKITVKLLVDGMVVAVKETWDGVANFSLAPDRYTVIVEPCEDSPYFYDAETPVILAEYLTSVSIVLHNRPSEKQKTVYAYSTLTQIFTDFDAQPVKEGRNYASATPNERTYFVFTPEEEGKYQIFLDTEHALLLGYFGDAEFAQADNMAIDLDKNLFILNVKPQNLGISYLIGITSSEAVALSASLHITRIGNAELDASDLPYTLISAQNLPSADFHADLHSVSNIKDISITDENIKVVLSESDDFYHLDTESGPLVYLRIQTPSQYLDPLKTVAEKTGLCAYFYDDQGKVLKKEQYNQLFIDYASITDPLYGLVPLTKELANALQNTGDFMEWWTFGSPNYLFGMTVVAPETAWLFAACTIAP